jgi:hypothetical protein
VDHIDQIRGKPVERVGVLVVHGIGEQRRFEHLESETRKIVDAIIGIYGKRRRDVTATLKTAGGDAFHGDQSTWVSGPDAPLHVLVELKGKIVDVAFHEVWWADVNEALTLGKQLRFWLWGLSVPGIAPNNTPMLPGTKTLTRPPNNAGKLTWWHRFRMAYVAILFGLSTFSISFINLILKRINFSPLFTTEVIVNYLSAVKLYSQTKRAGGSPMDGPDEPPRSAIRRRMIRTMIDVAATDYDRWYVLAHSLGSVVAWNGLMEIQQALPNYLDRDRWLAAATMPLRAASAAPFNVTAMMPNRPVWLGPREIIDREALFRKFRGLLTYGSPLERYCALWSNEVPINLMEDPFAPGTEWINVYDPTDPVGTWIADFDPVSTPRANHAVLKPSNFPCRASPILLLSHICYLTASRVQSLRIVNDQPSLLVNLVASWLVEGGSLASRIDQAPKGRLTFWMPLTAGRPSGAARVRAVWRFVQWVFVGCVLTMLALLSIHYVVLPALGTIRRWIG